MIEIVKDLFFDNIKDKLTDDALRLVAVAAASACGPGGVEEIAKVLNVNRSTFYAWQRQFDDAYIRQRRSGGGAHKKAKTDASLVADLGSLMEPSKSAKGEPVLRWTVKSLRTLADELKARQHKVSHMTVASLLKEQGYAYQKDCESMELSEIKQQFNHISGCIKVLLDNGIPVVLIETKMPALKKGKPTSRHSTRESSDALARRGLAKEENCCSPYGMNAEDCELENIKCADIAAVFEVDCIRRWWKCRGKDQYEGAQALCIIAGYGKSYYDNGLTLWKDELQRMADDYGLNVWVSHFPPGLCKWSNTEKLMLTRICTSWDKSFYQIMLSQITGQAKATGAKTFDELLKKVYRKTLRRSNKDTDSHNIYEQSGMEDWNYVIKPK